MTPHDANVIFALVAIASALVGFASLALPVSGRKAKPDHRRGANRYAGD